MGVWLCRCMLYLYIKYGKCIYIVTNFSLVTGSKMRMTCLIKKPALFSRAVTLHFFQSKTEIAPECKDKILDKAWTSGFCGSEKYYV